MSALSDKPLARSPQLDLGFAVHPHAGTRLVRRRTRYPFVLTSAFRLDSRPADMLTTIVQSASGAILGEDCLDQRIVVAAGAHAHVTTQAAMAVHRMPGGLVAKETVTLDVAAGALLEYMPAPRILFPESALRQTMTLTADPAAVVIVSDGFVIHDPEATGRHFRAYTGHIQLNRPDGTVLAEERFELAAPPNRFGRARESRAHGTLLAALPGSDADHRILTEVIDETVAAADVFAATSILPRGAGIFLRIVARDGARLRAATTAAWIAIRTAWTGAPPDRRRY